MVAGKDRNKGKQRGRGSAEAVVGQVDGGRAELEPDRERAGAWTLLIDGAPQSHVDLEDPGYLDFAYQRRIGHLIDLVAPARQPLNVVHLGGGAFTLARYTAASRPRSTQQVVEIDAALVAFVREHLPLDPQARVRVRAVDARAGLAKVPDGWADLVIADVFSGARTPAHLTSGEFLDDVRRALAPTGWYVANLADGPPLTHLRSQIATAASRFTELALAADPVVWRGNGSATPSWWPPTGSCPSRSSPAGSRATRTRAGSSTAGPWPTSRAAPRRSWTPRRWPLRSRRPRSSARRSSAGRSPAPQGSTISTSGGWSCHVQNTDTSRPSRVKVTRIQKSVFHTCIRQSAAGVAETSSAEEAPREKTTRPPETG